MAGNTNARKFDDNTEITNEDLSDLAGGRKNAYDIFDESADFRNNTADIRGQIQEAGDFLSEEEQQKFLKRLESIERKRDAEALSFFSEEIKETIEKTQRLTRDYFSQLDSNKELFGLDEAKKIDTLQEYKDDFASQELERKQKYLESLPDEIRTLRELRNKLVKLVGNSRVHIEEFGKLRRHEKREDYLPRLEENMRNFDDLMRRLEKSDEYSSQELNIMAVRFKESSLVDQEKLLGEWGAEKHKETKEAAESLTELKADFNKFSSARQSRNLHNFSEAKTRKEKTEIIASMRNELKTEYADKVNNTKYLSPAEKNLALASVSRKDFDIKFIEECLKSFDKCEDQVKQLAKIYESQPEEAKSHYNFWEANYDKKKGIVEAIKQHNKLSEEFEKKAHRMVERGLICKAAVEGENGEDGYIAKFKKLSLQKKKETLNSSPLDWPIRNEVLQQFKKLPEEYKKKMEKDFFQAHLKERMKMVIEAKEEINEKKSLQEKFSKKVNDFAKQKLIAQKTATAYKDWIKKLSLDDLREYYEDSELDDPLREKALNAFQSLDEKTQKENSSFYELDLDARMKLLRKLNPEAAKQIEEEAENENEAKEKVINFEEAVQIRTLKKAAKKFEEEGNEDAAAEIYQQILEIKPNDKTSREKVRESELGQNPLMQMLIYQSIKDNPALQRKLEGLRIVEIFEYMIEESERHEGARKLRDRSSRFEDEKMAKLNQTLYDYTKGEKILDSEGEAAKVKKLDVDGVRTAEDQSIVENYVHFFRDNRPDIYNENTSLGEKEYQGFEVTTRDGKELNLHRIREEKGKFMEDFGEDIENSAKKQGKNVKVRTEDLEEATRKFSRLKHINVD